MTRRPIPPSSQPPSAILEFSPAPAAAPRDAWYDSAAMRPRHADVAFVLEGVRGVLDVYALEHVDGSVGDLEFVVKLEHGTGHVAAAHYALLRVLSHEECRTVLFVEVDLPPALRARASHLDLSAAEREAARTRVPETSAALQQAVAQHLLPVYERAGFRVLIVGNDVDLYEAVVAAFGPTAERVVEASPFAAFWKARDEGFDLILCDARLAFGRDGLLAQLVAARSDAARNVVLLAHEGERDLLIASLDELGRWNSFLCKPADGDTLREILRTGSVVQRWTIPVLPARKPPGPEPPPDITRRVLVVDDDPATAMLLGSTPDAPLQVVVTTDEWEAVDQVGAPELALVVCSVTMRTRGGAPFYRLLWNARPDIKQRFVFIARADAVPASGPGAPVIERPITRDVISSLVERFTR